MQGKAEKPDSIIPKKYNSKQMVAKQIRDSH